MKNLKIKVCQSRGPSWISVLSVLTADSTGMVFFESALNVTTFTQAQIIRIFPILNAIQGHKLAREFHVIFHLKNRYGTNCPAIRAISLSQ